MSGNKEAEIILEASKAIEEVSEVLNKSMKKKLQKNEEEDKEEQTEESLEKDGDNLVGEIPESSEPDSDSLDSIIKGLSQSDLLNLASKALEALEGQGVPERSEDDIDAAEHEIKELKEDLPEATEISEEVDGMEMPVEEEVEAPETEEEIEAEEIVEDSEAYELDSMLAGKELEDLNKFYKKLGEHIAARSEVAKSSKESSEEEPKKDSKKEVESAIAPAMAMIKNMQKEFKKSFNESLAIISSKIDPLVSENRKLSHELSEMKKSYISLKKELDEIPSTKYASVNAKAQDKLLAKSMFSAPESDGSVEDARSSLVNRILAKQMVLAKSKNAPRVKFSEYVFRAEAAKTLSELSKIEKEIESFSIKL